MFEFGVTIRLPIQLTDNQKSRIRQQAVSAVKSYMPGNAVIELAREENDRRKELLGEMEKIVAMATAEDREFTADECRRFEQMRLEFKQLLTEAAEAAKPEEAKPCTKT